METRIEIDCSLHTWEALLEATILKGWDAELINFDFKLHEGLCSKIAERCKVQLIVNRGSKKATVRHLPKSSPPTV